MLSRVKKTEKQQENKKKMLSTLRFFRAGTSSVPVSSSKGQS